MTRPVRVPRVSLTNPIRDVIDTRTLQTLRRLGVVRETRVRNVAIRLQWQMMRESGVRPRPAVMALSDLYNVSPDAIQKIVYSPR